MEEALCFGWIDSRTNKVDEQCYKQVFSPRNPKSAWSKLNKQRIEKLLEQNLVTEAGLQKINAAKHNGLWNALDDIDELKLPPDLTKALSKNKTAKKYFDAFSPSAKKGILWWIETAKRPETRQKRIGEPLRMQHKIKANQYVRKNE